MQQGDESVCGFRVEYRACPSRPLIIGRARAANADAILVTAVLAGAPTSWLWAFPTIVDPDLGAEPDWVSRETQPREDPQRPRRVPKRHATFRRLYAIWRELARLLRKAGDRLRL